MPVSYVSDAHVELSVGYGMLCRVDATFPAAW
nr:MAG TPA: hypothetical protein [Caudoviricetes sp.]